MSSKNGKKEEMPLYSFPLERHLNAHRMIFEIRNSKNLRTEFIKDPETIMERYGIPKETREILCRGDPMEMYKHGIFPYFLHYYWISIMQAPSKGIENLLLNKKYSEVGN